MLVKRLVSGVVGVHIIFGIFFGVFFTRIILPGMARRIRVERLLHIYSPDLYVQGGLVEAIKNAVRQCYTQQYILYS